jgi:hypothetical protein
MAIRLTDPWPDGDAIRGVREATVAFRSSDPFVPRDIDRAPVRTVQGLLYLPPDAAPNRAIPAVVMLHGSAGMIRDRAKYGP